MKEKNGITLIALVITIIVMLILVAVTISLSTNGGLFGYAGKATQETARARNEEQNLGNLNNNMTTEQLIARFTGESAELAKLRKYFVGKKQNELMEELRI